MSEACYDQKPLKRLDGPLIAGACPLKTYGDWKIKKL
jgi:hypothetical protein